MLQAGDEFGRTQAGNNNAYCQDNELNWLDWSLAEKNKDLVNFVRQLIGIRRQAPGLRRDTFLKGARGPGHEHKDISWRHPEGRELTAADWHDGSAQTIGMLIGHAFTDVNGAEQGHLLLLCNAGDRSVTFILPQPQRDTEWRLAIDTARTSPVLMAAEPAVADGYTLEPHSAVLLTDGLHERRMRPRTGET
jgi:glycogen operon protein